MKRVGDVVARVCVVGALEFRARFEAAAGAPGADRDEAHAMAAGVTDWLREAGLFPELSPSERAFAETPVLTCSRAQLGVVADADQLEIVAALLFALSVVDTVGPYDVESDRELLRLLPFLSDSPFVTREGMPPAEELASMHCAVRLREPAALAGEEARAGLWLWRSRTAYLVHTGQLPVERADAILRDGAAKTKALGIPVVPPPSAPDFMAFGKPYRELGPTELVAASRIATARTHAIRWVLGDEAWDDVSLHS
jgi:hypothetical protein